MTLNDTETNIDQSKVIKLMPLSLRPKGGGYVEVPPPDVSSFSTPTNDAAITFIGNNTVNGVVFQHDQAFDIVASAKLLEVIQYGYINSLASPPPQNCVSCQYNNEIIRDCIVPVTSSAV